MERSVPLVGRLIEDAERDALRPTPQSEAGASYYGSVSEEDFRLEWSRSAEVLGRWISATPGRCFCEISGRRVYLGDAEAVAGLGVASPGVLIQVERTTCTVATAKGALRLGRAGLSQHEMGNAAPLFRALDLRQGDTLA
jgi:methionyl-tRNA formyltransferase